MRFKHIQDVVLWRLCTGCGACAAVCPQQKIRLTDIIDTGIRPVVPVDGCRDCGDCLRVCPGLEMAHEATNGTPAIVKSLKKAWGPIREVYEGYAADMALRFEGSSGGVTSALALYCLEREGVRGVVHSARNSEIPWKNRTVISRNKVDLLESAGSRYAPASPVEGLEHIEKTDGSWVFVGKPCDVEGVQKYQGIRPGMSEKIFLRLGIFCAGTPATLGTLELIGKLNIQRDSVQEIRYRGQGWPGSFKVKTKGAEKSDQSLPYREAWSFLQKYRPFRCYLCPDGTSEFADISCGDSWHMKDPEGETGSSLVLVRTERGGKIIRKAVDAGYLVLTKIEPKMVEAAQKNLLLKRQAIWGRLWAMKMMRVPVPAYQGFPLYENWRNLPLTDRLRSILGTARRVLERKYYRPLHIGEIQKVNL
jgi:coenzyme F420 hydrogenase subunit beta